MTSRKSVGIIGAGYTGLTAAYELAKKGYAVEVYERAQNLGGLAADFTIEGTPMEKAYHHLFRTDTDIIQLMQELGIGDRLGWFESSLGLYYDHKMYPFTTAFDLLKFSPLSLFDRVRAGLVVLFLQMYPNEHPFLKQTALDWMKKYSGSNVTQVIWEPLLRGKFHSYFDKVSMAWLWARIHTRANSKATGEVTEHLGYPMWGFKLITEALEQKVTELGGKIHTGISLSKIKKNEQTQQIDMYLQDRVVSHDVVLATTPSAIFAELIKDNQEIHTDYLQKLNSVDYLGAVLHIFSSDQSLSNFYWHNINDVNSPFLVFIQHTNLVGSKQYNNRHVYYIGTYVPHDHRFFSMPDDEIKSEWQSYLKMIFPHFDTSQLHEQYLFRFKNAQHIVTTDYVDLIPSMQTPVPGVFLSNFTQVFPEDRGTNFAVRDGKKVAALITDYLTRS